MKSDLSIYGAHAAFWATFVLTRVILARRDRDRAGKAGAAPVAQEGKVAPFSREVLAFHVLAFFTMYWGIGAAVFSRRIPVRLPYQRTMGTLVIVMGAALVIWALVHFRSWRLRAKLETGHQLATGGPFRFFRHPIYLGLNLLALGSAIWIPTSVVWAGFGLVALGGDLRGRAEEKLLGQAFGSLYRDYCRATARFLPGIY